MYAADDITTSLWTGYTEVSEVYTHFDWLVLR